MNEKIQALKENIQKVIIGKESTIDLLMTALLAKGHSIVVVEHNLDVIRAADWVIDLGPEAGDGGGHLVYAGTPENLPSCKESHTAAYL